ncbi:hypothetical protein GCM10009850_074860 [Nonomuraea monospora]|uniref:Uncharacterized protein n=1 Tax=Nonomuraea monospora TaxID=568818 RepID=A0ABN3CRE4_9ACTN
MLTMAPPPRSRIARKASRAKKNEPRALTAITASQSCAVVSVIGLLRVRPALLTRMSRPPKHLDGLPHRPLGRRLVRDVADQGTHAGKLPGQLPHLRPLVDGDDPGAAAVQQPDGLPAHAARGPGDEGDPPGELGRRIR